MFDMGKRICKLRRDAHLSQKQLGEKIGKSASTIGSYENDTAVPTPENAQHWRKRFMFRWIICCTVKRAAPFRCKR